MYILSCIFAVLCSAILPITLTVILCASYKGIWKPILFGALTFTVFQVLIRVPLLTLVLPNQGWFILMSSTQPVNYALFLGVTAALFEEGGRFLVMLLFMKKQTSTSDGLAFGIGHGGIEAILLVGISSVFLLFTPAELASAGTIAASGFERLSTLAIQIGFSVMVMKTVREKNYLWLLLAFTIHTVLDFGVMLISGGVSIWIIEAVVFAVALGMAWFTWREFKKFPDNMPERKQI